MSAQEKNDLAARVGRRIESIRTRRGLDINELALRSGIARTSIYRIERGYTARKSPELETLLQLSSALGVSLLALLPDECFRGEWEPMKS